MTTSTPGAEPPVAPHAAHAPGVGVVRPTARIRPHVRVRLRSGPGDGIPVHDPYVRTFWVATIGQGAVADLLRLIGCGRRRTTLKRPDFLHVLLRRELARIDEDGVIVVAESIPVVPAHLVRTLHPALRFAHAEWLRERSDD